MTCQANADVKESRIDYFITNDRLTPAVAACRVDNLADYPTHRPLIIDIITEELKVTTRELQKPTDFAELFEGKVQQEVMELKTEANEVGRANGEDPETIDEGKVRKNILENCMTTWTGNFTRGGIGECML